ncbi:hypothetical protein [Streptomyces sp. CBMA123]|uniref:hypothetical protein n=1 Tax=Streptomyces sp. CBMA123 TaxID=1896313 RepID=UPI001661FE34|nr:hypothetical protein [Streptomyces sp. CBMA123]MBD0689627.1 hypothetical protein [Streptomyces sp. CBMA123]
MASIIVLFEVDQGQAAGLEGDGPDVLRVHASGADPETPEDPLDRTLCGMSTGTLERSGYRPAQPGEPWYPVYLRAKRCRDCEDVLRRV